MIIAVGSLNVDFNAGMYYCRAALSSFHCINRNHADEPILLTIGGVRKIEV